MTITAQQQLDALYEYVGKVRLLIEATETTKPSEEPIRYCDFYTKIGEHLEVLDYKLAHPKASPKPSLKGGIDAAAGGND